MGMPPEGQPRCNTQNAPGPLAPLQRCNRNEEKKMLNPKDQREINNVELPSEPGVYVIVFRMCNRARPVWAAVGAESSRHARLFAQECRETWELATVLMVYDSSGPIPEPVYWMPHWLDVKLGRITD